MELAMKELYETYRQFQNEFREYALTAHKRKSAQERLNEDLEPVTFSCFCEWIESMSPAHRRFSVEKWCSGFSNWLRREIEEESLADNTCRDEIRAAELEGIARSLIQKYREATQVPEDSVRNLTTASAGKETLPRTP